MVIEDTNKLSILARADDLFRRMNYLSDVSTEEYVVAMAKLNRDLCSDLRFTEQERDSWKEKFSRLQEDFSLLDRKFKNAQESYKRDVGVKERITKERDAYREKLTQLRDILMEDMGPNYGDLRARRVLSCLDVNLERVDEVNESGGDYLSENEYDKSDDEVFQNRPPSCVQLKRATKGNSPSSKKTCTRFDHETTIEPAKEAEEVFRTLATELEAQMRSTKNDETRAPSSIHSTPALKPMKAADISHYHSQSKLENRKHKLVLKKTYRVSEKCSVCNGNLGFAHQCFRCSECQAVCHPNCRNKLPLPCVPYVPKNNAKKKGRLTTVADFVVLHSPPCVPALIIHCCTEIERRGLKEIGIYRIPGSEVEVKELKERILTSKSGMPVLSNYDVMTLCGVVKSFLKSFDDPLISRVLWRQFVDAAKIEDPEDRKPYIHQAISELPIANKHTLAYFILHLQRVAASPSCNMPIDNLSRVFGPTLVGTCVSPNNITNAHLPVLELQIKIVNALLTLSQDYWSSILTDHLVTHHSSPMASTINKRQSIGGRVIGGMLESEVLAPKTRMRPLF